VPTRLPADTLWGLLDLICSTPFAQPDDQTIAANAIAVGVLAGNVDALEPGFYLLDLDEKSISAVKAGAMMDKMAHACLDQGWLANCAVHFLFLADLDFLGRALGPRGYRYAMLTAGRLGQRIYLGATAMRIGCCGIGAFYDDEVTSVLGLSDTTTLLYLVAAGPLKKWTNAGG
jgi:SagB-type dehydrogenase family enzyme